MKVMLLAYETPGEFALRDDKAKYDAYMGGWYAYSEDINKNGGCEGGEALEVPGTATVVSVRDGRRHVQDGPFPDTKEQLGGFFIIETPDMETAASWAAKCPAAKTGYVDARPVPYLEEETAK